MNKFRTALALAALSATLSGGLAFAQDRDQDHHDNDNHKYAEHHEWKKGQQIKHEDWDRGERVQNYRQYHLNAPPRGHEWRLIDGNYVLVNTGNYQIRTVVVAH
jgi:Ni/Co efflux regulator RcnB